MPTSATGTSPSSLASVRRLARAARGAACGFTLIEILVVVVIIGVLTAGIVLSVNITGRDRELEKESDRLLALFNYAREQAELQTREFGVMFQDDGYEFLTYDPRRAGWRSVFEDDALVARHLPDGLGFKLSVETRPVVLNRPKDAKNKTPQVMIFSNGDLTTFAATLEREGGMRSVTLTEDNKGQVVLQPLEERRP
ncbi:MAG TPA: type II secretion system minor pseudopilin GspH [Steroidobacteraceae bacterium]|nr:type II secretion system minor pseudopilin GspH [Steroidobacteraceae bacterium]